MLCVGNVMSSSAEKSINASTFLDTWHCRLLLVANYIPSSDASGHLHGFSHGIMTGRTSSSGQSSLVWRIGIAVVVISALATLFYVFVDTANKSKAHQKAFHHLELASETYAAAKDALAPYIKDPTYTSPLRCAAKFVQREVSHVYRCALDVPPVYFNPLEAPPHIATIPWCGIPMLVGHENGAPVYEQAPLNIRSRRDWSKLPGLTHEERMKNLEPADICLGYRNAKKDFLGFHYLSGPPKAGTTFIHSLVVEAVAAAFEVPMHLSPTRLHSFHSCMKAQRSRNNLPPHVAEMIDATPLFSHYAMVKRGDVQPSNSWATQLKMGLSMDTLKQAIGVIFAREPPTPSIPLLPAESSATGQRIANGLPRGCYVSISRDMFASVRSQVMYFGTEVLPVVERNMRYYSAVAALIKSPHNAGRIRLIRYEDFVSSTASELSETLRFYGFDVATTTEGNSGKKRTKKGWKSSHSGSPTSFESIDGVHISDLEIEEAVFWSSKPVMSAVERAIPRATNCSDSDESEWVPNKVRKHVGHEELHDSLWWETCVAMNLMLKWAPDFIDEMREVFGYDYSRIVGDCGDSTSGDGDIVDKELVSNYLTLHKIPSKYRPLECADTGAKVGKETEGALEEASSSEKASEEQ